VEEGVRRAWTAGPDGPAAGRKARYPLAGIDTARDPHAQGEQPQLGLRISDALARGPALPASAAAVSKVLHEAAYELEEVATQPHSDKPRFFERVTPKQLWQSDLFTFVLKRQNRRVYQNERDTFQVAVVQCTRQLQHELCTADQSLTDTCSALIHRRAVRHALVELGYLDITRRSIPQRLHIAKCARIT
jgi:hypothetical protein